MQVVVLVNAVPSFEDAVVASLRKAAGVRGIVRVKKENFDIAVLLDVADEAEVQTFLTSRLRMISGVAGVERLANPNPDLVKKLESTKR